MAAGVLLLGGIFVGRVFAGDPPPAPKPAPPVAQEARVPSWAKVAPEQIEAAKAAGVPVAFENSIGMRFVLIPAGTFTMGSPANEPGRFDDERPHEVTLTKPYYLATTEVTNAQFRKFSPEHDGGAYGDQTLDGDEQPAVEVSWEEAAEFVAWLRAQDAVRAYRLPTEAEWERACRAGTTTARFWGDRLEDAVRFANVLTEETRPLLHGIREAFPGKDGYPVSAPVGKFLPNAFGLYDMLGNAWEWCADWHGEYPKGPVTDPSGPQSGTERVTRGGAWGNGPRVVRGANRGWLVPDDRRGALGFRLAVSVPSK